MRKRQILFVTYRDGNLDEGFSYAVELAKAMSENIVLLLVQRKDRFMKKVENLMSAVSFAEAGEHETAREILAGGPQKTAMEYEKNIAEFAAKYDKEGVLLSVQSAESDVISGIRDFLKQNPGIDKVVLSPEVTEREVLSTKELTRLVRTASRPIVTMTRQSSHARKEISVRASEPEFAHH
jgi:hypothetical protein